MARTQARSPKFYINNAFTASESGNVKSLNGLAIPLASVKDLKACVESAHRGFAQWSAVSPHQRIEWLYQIARRMEDDAKSLTAHFKRDQISNSQSTITAICDFHYSSCGWPGKLETLLSSVNTIAHKHVSYTIPEPLGCIAVLPGTKTSFKNLWTTSISLICAGNSVILLLPIKFANAAFSLCEHIHLGKLPAGLLNVVFIDNTSHFNNIVSHRGIHAVMCDFIMQESLLALASEHQLRVLPWTQHSDFETLQHAVQYKTIWTPMDLPESQNAVLY